MVGSFFDRCDRTTPLGRRAVLALGALAISATSAASDPVCTSATLTGRAVVPDDGARDVPRNASVWLYGNFGGATETGEGVQELTATDFRVVRGARGRVVFERRVVGGMLELRPRSLVAGRSYALLDGADPVVTFTTTTVVDRSPPEVPELEHLDASQIGRSATITLQLVTPTDSVAIAIKASLAGRFLANVVVPATSLARLSCVVPALAQETAVCLDVQAMDVAGNRSKVVKRCANVVAGPPTVDSADTTWFSGYVPSPKGKDRPPTSDRVSP